MEGNIPPDETLKRQMRVSMDPEMGAAGPIDLDKLREELAAERRTRAWLESRLEELELRLRRSQAAERSMQNAAARDQVSVLGLHAPSVAESAGESDREELDLWLQVAAMTAEAAPVAALAPAARVEPIQVVREPVADRRYEEKLAEARAAMEQAEARAAHQAAQMRRLTEELAASRAEQMRALGRIQELEKKLVRIEAQADLLDSTVSERVVDKGAPEFELPAETMAPLQPVKPGLVYTETEAGVQLSPAEPEVEDETPGLSLEEFEPKAYPREAQPAAEAEGGSLEDALSDLFGEVPSENDVAIEPLAAAAEATNAPSESMDALADALEVWGGGPAEVFEQSAQPAPEAEAAALRGMGGDDDDPFSGLASALETLTSAPIEAPAEETQPAVAAEYDPFGGLAAAMEDLGEETVVEELAAEEPVETHDADAVEEEQPAEAETIVVDTGSDTPEAPARGQTLQEALEQVEEEAASARVLERQEPGTEPSAKPERAAAMAESLSTWSDEPVENGKEKPVPPKGRAAMVDALLRFMGPQ